MFYLKIRYECEVRLRRRSENDWSPGNCPLCGFINEQKESSEFFYRPHEQPIGKFGVDNAGDLLELYNSVIVAIFPHEIISK